MPWVQDAANPERLTWLEPTNSAVDTSGAVIASVTNANETGTWAWQPNIITVAAGAQATPVTSAPFATPEELTRHTLLLYREYYQRYFNTLQEFAPRPPIPVEPPDTFQLPEERDDMSLELINSFRVGCDPEFIVLNSDGRPHNVHNEIVSPGGLVGWDHGGDVLELRPLPSRSTYMIMRRIQALLNGHPRLAKLRHLRWRAGAFYRTPKEQHRDLALGGHVHLDVPYVSHSEDDQQLYTDRLRALDELEATLEQLEIFPNSECTRRRRLTEYGKMSDVRRGGTNRLEYRTPPSWLYDPKAAYICLTGSKLAVYAPESSYRLLGGFKSRSRLKRFFQTFGSKDSDATRVTEKILDGKLECDPDKDVKAAWETLPF